jgi:hypothetical protein
VGEGGRARGQSRGRGEIRVLTLMHSVHKLLRREKFFNLC